MQLNEFVVLYCDELFPVQPLMHSLQMEPRPIWPLNLSLDTSSTQPSSRGGRTMNLLTYPTHIRLLSIKTVNKIGLLSFLLLVIVKKRFKKVRIKSI